MRRADHDVVKLPIEFSFILSRVFSLKVATFCSNPFEHVLRHFVKIKEYNLSTYLHSAYYDLKIVGEFRAPFTNGTYTYPSYIDTI